MIRVAKVILEYLRLYNFRCYDVAELRPDNKFNVIFGLNGHGKTSILEAIGLLTTLRSFRGARNGEMLRLGAAEGSINGIVRNRDLSLQLAVKLWPTRKQATFNGKSCKFLSEYVGKVSAVTFSPADLEIIRGSPENRRLWVDKLAQLVDPEHADAVSRYQKILEHRNRQLKMLAEQGSRKLPVDFQIWTDELVLWGAKIIHNRIHSVDKAVDKIRNYYRKISQENIDLTIEYRSEIFDKDPYRQQTHSSLELIGQAFGKNLENSLQRELILGSTLVGPHRDDLEVSIAGNPAKSFGSQGEIRSLVLAMRLTEVELSKLIQGLSPILLIDDFSSELDARRRSFLLDYLVESDSQVFLSTTEELRIGKTFLVNERRIHPHVNGHVLEAEFQ